MIFKEFQLRNYKSFVDSGKCSVQNGVTILAGQNECGKSNVLNALVKINEKEPVFAHDEFSFCQTDEIPHINYWFELTTNELHKLAETFPQIDLSNEVMVDVQPKKRELTYSYQFKEGQDNSDVSQELLSHMESLLPKFVLYETVTNDIPDTFTVQDLQKTPLKRLSKYLNADFAKIFSEKSQQQQRNLTRNLSRLISTDFASKYRQKEVWLEFDINGSTIAIYVQDKKPAEPDMGFSFQLKQRSTGLRWYLNFYIALKGEALKAGDIILVDEPGMYLHPKAQQEMRGILNEEGKNNQIIYTTHSPYLIDADNIGQVRLVEKKGIESSNGYNEISEIHERLHHSKNIDTLKPITDAIGYSLGSELNIRHKKILICEGVSDYYYIKTIEKLLGTDLNCGITHANGCNNIGKIASVYQGLGIPEIYALVDSDDGGIKERNKLLKDGVFAENRFLTTHDEKIQNMAIEDLFRREWFLKEVFALTSDEIKKAEPLLSKEMKKRHGGAKFVWAKKVYDMALSNQLVCDDVLEDTAKKLFDKLMNALATPDDTH